MWERDEKNGKGKKGPPLNLAWGPRGLNPALRIQTRRLTPGHATINYIRYLCKNLFTRLLTFACTCANTCRCVGHDIVQVPIHIK